MRKTPSSFFATGSILLIALAPAAFAQNGTLLFESDFGPTTEQPHDPQVYAPGWDPDAPGGWSGGEYPHVIWQNDSGRASPATTNGYWKELVRDPQEADTGEIGFTTEQFSVANHRGEVLIISFDFKVGTDSNVNNGNVDGRFDFRFIEGQGDQDGGIAHEITLIDGGQLITNEESPGGSTQFDWEVTDLGDGWVNIELTSRTIGENSDFARIWIAPWTQQVGWPGHFAGSVGIDNLVVLSGGLPPEPPERTGISMSFFDSDFAPTEAMPHNVEVFSDDDPGDPEWVYPVGWGGAFGQASANYPQAAWRHEPDWASEVSNGYFLEGRRPSGDSSFGYIRSTGLSQTSSPLIIEFDFKLGADSGFNNGESLGRLDFRVMHWAPGWESISMILADQGVVRGEEGTEGWEASGAFEEIEISEPDANGWRTYTLRVEGGLMRNQDDFLIWFAPWTFGDANAAAGHFEGSFGIDNFSIRSELPTGVPLDIALATEVEFFGESGRLYMIEAREPGGEWEPVTDIIPGLGQPVFRIFSTKDAPDTEFRVVSDGGGE